MLLTVVRTNHIMLRAGNVTFLRKATYGGGFLRSKVRSSFWMKFTGLPLPDGIDCSVCTTIIETTEATKFQSSRDRQRTQRSK